MHDSTASEWTNGNWCSILDVLVILFHLFYLVLEPPLEVDIITPSMGHEGEVTLTTSATASKWQQLRCLKFRFQELQTPCSSRQPFLVPAASSSLVLGSPSPGAEDPSGPLSPRGLRLGLTQMGGPWSRGPWSRREGQGWAQGAAW